MKPNARREILETLERSGGGWTSGAKALTKGFRFDLRGALDRLYRDGFVDGWGSDYNTCTWVLTKKGREELARFLESDTE